MEFGKFFFNRSILLKILTWLQLSTIANHNPIFYIASHRSKLLDFLNNLLPLYNFPKYNMVSI